MALVSSTSAQEQRERGDFKEDEREKEPIVLQKQLNKKKPDW